MEEELLAFIKQPIPENMPIVAQSIPILFFGNINTAKSATISINPSYAEFTDKHGKIFPSAQKRFIDRDELGVKDTDELSDHEAKRVYDSCMNVFNKRPYKHWFNPLNSLLEPIVGSYYDGSLIGLDITPWATNPVWSQLSESDKQNLTKQGENGNLVKK